MAGAASLAVFTTITASDRQGLRRIANGGTAAAENLSTLCALNLYLDLAHMPQNVRRLAGASIED